MTQQSTKPPKIMIPGMPDLGPLADLVRCECICHERGLNPWIASCPRCGCVNPKFDENAKPDFDFGL